jgi:hypothetical protein
MVIRGLKKKFWMPPSPALWHKASGGGGGGPALVAGQVNVGTAPASGTSVSVTLPNPVSPNGCVCLFYGSAGTGNPFSSAGDDKGNADYIAAYGLPNAENSFSWGSSVLSGINNAPQTFTVNWTGARTFSRLIAVEYAGIDPTSPINGTPVADTQNSPAATTDSITSGNTTTTVNGCLIVGSLVNTSGSGTENGGTGFTVDQHTAGVTIVEHMIQATAGAIAATATPTSALDDFICGVYGLTPA